MNYEKIDKIFYNYVQTQNDLSKTYNCIVFLKDIKLMNKFLYNHNILVIKSFPFINAIALNLTMRQIECLSQLSQVVFINANMQISAQVNRARQIMNINDLHKSGYKGDGVTVAVIDTGCANHMDICTPSNRIKFFKDFVNKKNTLYDDNGHGTNVCGLLAGNGMKSAGKYKGIAPNVDLIVLKVLDSNGQTSSIEMLESMEWLEKNAIKYNIKIVCMSFGATSVRYNDPLVIGAERLWQKGICVVAAAGNSGPNEQTIKSPASSRKIITVGAFDDNYENNKDLLSSKFTVPDFSSRGPAYENYKPDVLASGVDIQTTSREGDYIKCTGTSMSTPLIAGSCALICQYYKNKISPNEIKSIILSNCDSLGADRNTEGYGIFRFSK